MKQSINSEDWLNDFNEFMNTPSEAVPSQLFKNLKRVIHKDLNPNPWLIFAKLSGIHTVVGSLSLLICSQFGMGASHGNHFFMSLAMRFGEIGCMLFCGFLFVGLSLLIAGLALTIPEMKILRRTAFLQISSLGILSLGAFLCFGAEIVINLSIFWLLGAIIGGISMTELSWKMRIRPVLLQNPR